MRVESTESATHIHAGSAAIAPEPAGVRPAAVVVSNLMKAYGPVQAVDGLSFSVGRGEVFALLGPNGAGKTTALEILEGYRTADAGSVSVLGLDPGRDSRHLKARCGVMLQQDGLHPGLSAREILRLYASFYAQPADPIMLLDRVGLRDSASVRCRRLSGGQKRRLALALALIGHPELIFLDEPTTGMDPQARLTTWDIIRELRSDGTTIMLTTHLMDEAERLADRVAIVNRGRLVALDSPASLMRREEVGFVRMIAAPGLDAVALSSVPHVRRARETSSGVYALETDNVRAMLADMTAWLRDHSVTLTEIRVGHSSLEEAYLRLTRKDDEA